MSHSAQWVRPEIFPHHVGELSQEASVGVVNAVKFHFIPKSFETPPPMQASDQEQHGEWGGVPDGLFVQGAQNVPGGLLSGHFKSLVGAEASLVSTNPKRMFVMWMLYFRTRSPKLSTYRDSPALVLAYAGLSGE